MLPQIVYISSDARSGSTLLDQLLGSHPRIHSVGEIHHLNEYATEDRSHYNPAHPLICSCGETVPDCEFWSAVESRLARPLSNIHLNPYLTRVAGKDIPAFKRRRTFVKLVEDRPWLYRYSPIRWLSGGEQAAADSFDLFDAIAEVSGSDTIVDSSKSPFRFSSLFRLRPERLKLIALVRDYRGVVHSKMKRGQELVPSLTAWSKRLQQMELMSKDVPGKNIMRLKYEDLCLDSEAVMRDICDFIGVDFDSGVLSRSSQDLHHIGGSPSKFQETKREIRLDESHLTAFSKDELDYMREQVGSQANRWGYEP